jgi:hypothetical protein
VLEFTVVLVSVREVIRVHLGVAELEKLGGDV